MQNYFPDFIHNFFSETPLQPFDNKDLNVLWSVFWKLQTDVKNILGKAKPKLEIIFDTWLHLFTFDRV